MDHPTRPLRAAVCGVLFLIATSASAQSAQQGAAPAIPRASTAPLAVPNPHYVTVTVEQHVNRPAQAVWARVGKFCDIGEWLRATCVISSGVDGQLGAVRVVASGFIEMLVAKTDLSYTYAQPVRQGVPYNAYHGTVEAKPVTTSTSKLIVSFFYDNSMFADDAARAAEIENRRARYIAALLNMKLLAEGFTMPLEPLPAVILR